MTESSATEVRGFERFIAACGRALWRAAWLLTGDSQHAEDLVQTALSKCFTRDDDIEGDEAFEAYVRTTIHRTYVSWWRRRRWRASLEFMRARSSPTPTDVALHCAARSILPDMR